MASTSRHWGLGLVSSFLLACAVLPAPGALTDPARAAPVAAIQALTSVSVQEKQAEARGIVPARIEALPAWAEGKTEGAADVVEALLADATPQRTTPTWNQVETLMTQYGVQGYRGELTAEEIMETIQNSVAG